jgi:hypothetical protein
VLNEFYRVAFRKKVYRSIDELQDDLDPWICEYNESQLHQGRWCFGTNADANLPGCNANGEGENERRLTTSDIKTRSLNQANICQIELRLHTQ